MVGQLQVQARRANIPSAFSILFSPYRYKAFHGGRGSAKSHSVAAALVTLGAQRPMRIGCYREVMRSLANSVKRLLDDKIKELGLEAHYNSTQFGIEGINGTSFLFGGLRTNPDAIKSTEGLDVAWIEEADRASQNSLDLLTPTLRKPGSELWVTWNRRTAKDPVDVMFLGGTPPPDSYVRQVSWRDNPWFPQVLRNEMEWMKRRDHDKWRHIWEGDLLKRSNARVFNNWTVDDLDGAVPDGASVRFGADWGFSSDPTVLVKCYRWGRTLYVSDEAYMVKCEIDDIPALFCGSDPQCRWKNPNKHQGIVGASKYPIVADSSRPETISYVRRQGLDIRKAIKGRGSVEEGVEFLKSQDIIVHPRCTHTIDELECYSYAEDDLTGEILPELADRHNHVIDALRYALEGDRRAGLVGELPLDGAIGLITSASEGPIKPSDLGLEGDLSLLDDLDYYGASTLDEIIPGWRYGE